MSNSTAAPPALTEGQWQALAEAEAAVRRAQADLDRALGQRRLVVAALGVEGEWTVDPFQRTIAPVTGGTP